MNLATVASADEPLAFRAYHSLIGPALRDVACRPLRRARHYGGSCSGSDGTRWCHDCEEVIDDHLWIGYTSLRKALRGSSPRTRAGAVVREMQAVVTWLTAPEAATTPLDTASHQLRQRPSAVDPAGLRAARAQLVHYPLRSLEARVRRDDLVRLGASARPERDLNQSAWAGPLRADPAAFTLLLDATTRLRNGCTDPYAIPGHLLDQLALDSNTACRLLRGALETLREIRPDFFRANVFLHREQGQYRQDMFTVASPEALLIDAETRTDARQKIGRLLAKDLRAEGPGSYQTLLGRIVSPAPPDKADLISWTARELRLSDAAAHDLITHLIALVTDADLDEVIQGSPPGALMGSTASRRAPRPA